jgi:hypothetical protein
MLPNFFKVAFLSHGKLFIGAFISHHALLYFLLVFHLLPHHVDHRHQTQEAVQSQIQSQSQAREYSPCLPYHLSPAQLWCCLWGKGESLVQQSIAIP